MFDDEGSVIPPAAKRALVATPVLDSWGVEELGEYIAALQAEVERARARVAAKQSHRSAADALFRAASADGG